MYELHPTMEYPAGQELSPSQKLVEKVVEVIAAASENRHGEPLSDPYPSYTRNNMEQLIAKELGIGRTSAKFGISCAIMDGFIQTTSGVCEAEEEGARLMEESSGAVAEIVSELSELVVKDNLERLADAEKPDKPLLEKEVAMDSGLEKAVALYRQCDHCCTTCPLNKPVEEHCENPTYCDVLMGIDNNFNGD